ncbi:MAG: ATP-binding cassette domain-containing protein [Fluviicola sp.]
MIQIQQLNKSFGSKEVLKNIDLTFEKGTITGIVGENGAGKTTLFRCIAGLENYEGTILSDANPLKDKLGLLFTDPFFFSKITGKEYLQFMCNARGVKIADFNSRNIFDLPLNQYAMSYSTGMKKKLAILAILLQENDYFIFDEPFNGVDIQSNIVITEIILKLKEMNKTVLISSHIFSTLNDTCDKIHLLQDGEIKRTVEKNEFSELEAEMKAFAIGNKIDLLNLK